MKRENNLFFLKKSMKNKYLHLYFCFNEFSTGFSFQIWWQRWLVLYRATSKGTTRLSVYSNNKATKDKPKASLSVQSIQTVLRLSSKVKKYAIAIVTKDNYSWELSFETGKMFQRFEFSKSVIISQFVNHFKCQSIEIEPLNRCQISQNYKPCMLYL